MVPSSTARFAGRIARDVRGIVALEFGYIAPLLLVLLLGVIEVSRAIIIDRRLALVTSRVGDMVSREKTMTADNLNAIYSIAEQVMAPYDTASLKISVIPVKAKTNSEFCVYPSSANRPSHNGGAVPAQLSTYVLSNGLATVGDNGQTESVIVVETSYNFEPVISNFLVGPTTWNDKSIHKPRQVLCVDFDENGAPCGPTC